MGRLTMLATAVVLLAGCGGRSAGGHNQNDPAPDAGPSRPSIDNLADGGWRDSTEPWRPPVDPHASFGMNVWSHPGAVFTGYNLSYLNEGLGTDHALGIAVNRGTGWSSWLDLDEAQFIQMWHLRGFPNGNELVVLGTRQLSGNGPDEQFGIFHVTAGGVASFTEGPGPEARHLFVVDEELAYIAASDTVLRFDIDHWEPLPATPPYEVRRIWATRNVLFGVAEGSGIIVSLESDQWRMHDSGTLASLTGIWGFGDNDIYVCDHRGNLLHYDGTVWSPIPWADAPSQQQSGGFDMWGSQGVLFLYSEHMLVRYGGQGFEVVADWRCLESHGCCQTMLRIEDLWGNAPDEVFLAVAQTHLELRDNGCYPIDEDVYLLYFDGELFHWF